MMGVLLKCCEIQVALNYVTKAKPYDLLLYGVGHLLIVIVGTVFEGVDLPWHLTS